MSLARIERLNGALAPTVVDSIDVAPMLTFDGHLLAGSPLRDRGLAGIGALAGIEDTLDIDREPRIQGPAPDIGSDELAPIPPPDAGPPPPAPKPVAPKLSKVSLAKSFRSKCPRPKRGRKRCKAGVTIKLRLDRAATVRFSFKRKSTRKRLRKTYSFSKKLKAGAEQVPLLREDPRPCPAEGRLHADDRRDRARGPEVGGGQEVDPGEVASGLSGERGVAG